ncbi:MAG: hypothetical protein M3297_15360 [Thermoproteota archaeon]|nr:hypothetical protein [Thermoproteota archaeon]
MMQKPLQLTSERCGVRATLNETRREKDDSNCYREWERYRKETAVLLARKGENVVLILGLVVMLGQ